MLTINATMETKTRRGHQRGGTYKLVFRPAEYTGPMAQKVMHLPEHERPLITFRNNSLNRCYVLVKRYKMVWAGIYDQHAPSNTPPVAVYTAENEWNNPTV